MMPEMDGLQLLKAIREESKDQKHIPVLMITALGKQDDIMKAARLEINGYIVKPFSVNTVLAKIEEILG
jgi:two-component system chemotaxis response regulator CheY